MSASLSVLGPSSRVSALTPASPSERRPLPRHLRWGVRPLLGLDTTVQTTAIYLHCPHICRRPVRRGKMVCYQQTKKPFTYHLLILYLEGSCLSLWWLVTVYSVSKEIAFPGSLTLSRTAQRTGNCKGEWSVLSQLQVSGVHMGGCPENCYLPSAGAPFWGYWWVLIRKVTAEGSLYPPMTSLQAPAGPDGGPAVVKCRWVH